MLSYTCTSLDDTVFLGNEWMKKMNPVQTLARESRILDDKTLTNMFSLGPVRMGGYKT